MIAVAFAAMFLALARPARADFVLGQAANYTVLGLTGTTLDFSNTTVTGSVGASAGGTLDMMAPSKIVGQAFLDPTASLSGFSDSAHITGGITVQSMSTAVSDSLNAYQTYTSLAPSQTFSSGISTATTITGSGGVDVISITGNIDLNNANLKLAGGPNDVFVLNVTGNISLVGTASIIGSGVSPNQILIDMDNLAANPSSHPTTVTTHVGDVIDGTVLAPYSTGNLDGQFNGRLIFGGSDLSLLSGVTVNGQSVPEPGSVLAVLMGLFPLSLIRHRRSKADTF